MKKLTKRLTKVTELELASDLSILHIGTFSQMIDLCDKADSLLETDDSYFLLKGSVAFRCIKNGAKPKILRAREFQFNPDSVSVKVVIDADELLRFAVRHRIPIFETESEFIIPSDITLIAKKEKQHERDSGKNESTLNL